MSPTSAATFSLQLETASKDSLSVVEKTSTQAWAPVRSQNRNVIDTDETILYMVGETSTYSQQPSFPRSMVNSLRFSYKPYSTSQRANVYQHV
jgi:hypothetical protein